MHQFNKQSFAKQADETALMPLAELLGALSYALDITEGQPEGHCLRACWVGIHLGQAIGLDEAAFADLYYVLLLKDLGCSSNAARLCELYLADDRAFKRDFKLIGGSLKDALGFVFARTGEGLPLRTRASGILNILRNGSEISRTLIETRCTRGADIARRLRFSDAVADGIYGLDEHWDGSGKPDGVKGEAIPLFARIALLAQLVEVFHRNSGRDAALAEIARRSGGWLDPALVAAFARVARDPAFWAGLAAPDIEARLLGLAPAQALAPVDEAYLDDISAAFGEIVDAKSPFTAGHSTRVAGYAVAVAERLDHLPEKRSWLRRGALLHDIGKLGVSNRILDKPGKLDGNEWSSMQRHAGDTQAILGRISGFHDLAPIAAAHHERLDGTGYPLRLDERAISLETRIITIADIFDALTADRPYRGALPLDEALGIIRSMVGTAIDPRCLAALEEVARS